ncbi:hypothetical protein HNR23_000482 [Nocardiopsis mwathae]|uniref:Uncharacterized protein n=1 Tax=Nocardiopsis mwathae TaxID=1472723 RepID=A0A7W9YE50_9ACTN|nr:hypothetical protein [Nocardiopsis mwathae]MBB6170422.1 hypothetical protein [Nocardiopsis mwathae]
MTSIPIPRPPRRPRWTAAAVAATATALTAGLVAVPAQAAAADDGLPHAPPTTSLGPADTRAPTGISPAGCVGKTHDPHRSSHVRGTVNVVADTRCRSSVPSVGVSTVLHRSRWYGWQKRGESGLKTERSSRSVEANAGSPRCVGDTHDWLGSSYHESVEDGTTYVGRTSKRRNNITC